MRKRTLGITPINKHLLAIIVHLVPDWVKCIFFSASCRTRLTTPQWNTCNCKQTTRVATQHDGVSGMTARAALPKTRRLKIVSKPTVCCLAVAQKARQTLRSRAQVRGEAAVVLMCCLEHVEERRRRVLRIGHRRAHNVFDEGAFDGALHAALWWYRGNTCHKDRGSD